MLYLILDKRLGIKQERFAFTITVFENQNPYGMFFQNREGPKRQFDQN